MEICKESRMTESLDKTMQDGRHFISDSCR